jgi:hypothetical protein
MMSRNLTRRLERLETRRVASEPPTFDINVVNGRGQVVERVRLTRDGIERLGAADATTAAEPPPRCGFR